MRLKWRTRDGRSNHSRREQHLQIRDNAAQSWLDKTSQNLLVIYDGRCGLCRASVNWLRARDKRNALCCKSLQTPGLLASLGFDTANALQQMVVVDGFGECRRGADGVVWAISQLNGLRWLGGLFLFPGVRSIAVRVYRLVASFRKRDRCDDESCQL